MRTDSTDWLLIGLAVWVGLAVIGLVSLVYWATRLLEVLL
jgi:hypothetical protein